MTLGQPNWALAAGFALVGVILVVALKVYLRGKEVWRYDTRAAWLRAFAYFAFAWALAAASGTLATIADNPVVFPDQWGDPLWIAFTVLVIGVIAFGYGYYWPRGTLPHGRRITPDSVVFGACWGVSEGLLFGSVWVLAVRLFDDVGDASSWAKGVGVALVTIVVLSLFIGLWHALYWDVHVAPEHNIIEFNNKKVLFAHNPNVLLSTVYVTVYDNLALFVGLQAVALMCSSIAMPFPSPRRPHPPDPSRPELGAPVRIGSADMTGRVVVVTGGARGIGAVVARRLAAQRAHLVLVDKRETEVRATAASINADTGATVDVVVTDLSSAEQVRELAAALEAEYPRIDVLVNNAGIFTTRYGENEDGVELTLATNHLGHFLLTVLLLDRLRESEARVIFVSSDAHRQAKPIDWTDVNLRSAWGEREVSASAGSAVYNQSKLMLTAAAMELAARTADTGLSVNVVAPGALVPTGIYDELGGPAAVFIRVFRPVLRTPWKASQGHVHLASSPEVEGVTGWYWKDVRPLDESELARDPELRRQVWEWSCRAAGVSATLR